MSIRNITTGLAAFVLVALALAAMSAPSAGALSKADYMSRLERNGYKATTGATVDHPGFAVDGVIIKVESNGKSATVEVLDYGSNAALQKDWIAVNGEGPKPRVATKDFDGRVLYWNNDSILVVDYRSPNDSLIARAAANAYLGLPGSGGQPGQPTAAPGSPTATPGKFPPTGGPIGDAGDDESVTTAILVALGVALIAVGSAQIYTSRRTR